MSMAAKLQAKFDAQRERQYKRSSRPLLYQTLRGIEKVKQACVTKNSDFCIFITGMEGSGKSTLASHIAQAFNPDFDVNTQMIYDLKGSQNSFLEFTEKYKDMPFKAAWFDEAVSVLFSLRHNSRDSAEAQELFKAKRFYRHFDILVSPSFWDIVPDLRDRRVRMLFYCFNEPKPGKVGAPTEYVYKVAVYGLDKIPHLSWNKKAKLAFRSPQELFKIVKPDYIEAFPPMDPVFSVEYMKSKNMHADALLNRMRGVKSPDTGEKKPPVTEISII